MTVETGDGPDIIVFEIGWKEGRAKRRMTGEYSWKRRGRKWKPADAGFYQSMEAARAGALDLIAHGWA